ncbi:MAG: hypothetical protein ACK4GQ_00475 [Candidatus Hadarchaeales archaeon]
MGGDKRGFVLSGIALLLVLPAMMLTASFLAIVGMGGETASLQGVADKVFYTGKDIERVLADVWRENLLFDNENNANRYFSYLADNYRTATGLLVEITPKWKLWTYAKYTNENILAGSAKTKIARTSQENWYYYFEIGRLPDWNEPILLVTKLSDNLRITLNRYHFPVSDNWSHIYYDDIKLWDTVRHNDPRVGSENIVSGTTQLTVSIDVRDPRGAARYTSTVDLG